MRNWIIRHRIHHKFRVAVLLFGLGGYCISLVMWFFFMNLLVYAPSSGFVALLELHPYISSLVFWGATLFFDRLKTILLIILLLVPFALMALAVTNAYSAF